MEWKPISEPIPEGAHVVCWDGMEFFVVNYAPPQGNTNDYEGVTHWGRLFPPPSQSGGTEKT